MKASKLLLLSCVCLLAGCNNDAGMTKRDYIIKYITQEQYTSVNYIITPYTMTQNEIEHNSYANYWWNFENSFVYYYSVEKFIGRAYSYELWTLITSVRADGENKKIKESELLKISNRTIYSIIF